MYNKRIVAMDITMMMQMVVSGKTRKNRFLLKRNKYDRLPEDTVPLGNKIFYN